MTIRHHDDVPVRNGMPVDEYAHPDDGARRPHLGGPGEHDGTPTGDDATGSTHYIRRDGHANGHLSAVRRHWAIVVSGLFVGLFLGSMAVNLVTPQYRSTAQVFIAFQASDVSPESMLQGLTFTQQQVASYADIVTSPLVLQPVIESLGLEEAPEDLADRVEASARTDTVLVDVTVTDEEPAMAQRIADEIALSLGDAIVGLERPVGTAPAPVQVTTVRPGLLPKEPAVPNRLFIVAVGGALGLSAGVGLSLLIQSRRDRVAQRGLGSADHDSGSRP